MWTGRWALQQASLTLAHLPAAGSVGRCFFDVFPGVVKQPDDVMVVERVVGEPPGPPHAHEPGGTQQSQLMGHGRLGHSNERGQIADTSLAVGQRVHEPHASRVAEQPEHLRNRLDGSRTQEQGADALEDSAVGCMWTRTGQVGIRLGSGDWGCRGHVI